MAVNEWCLDSELEIMGWLLEVILVWIGKWSREFIEVNYVIMLLNIDISQK